MESMEYSGACESPQYRTVRIFLEVEIVNLLTLMFMYSVWSYDIIFADVCCTLLNGGVSQYNFSGGSTYVGIAAFTFNRA